MNDLDTATFADVSIVARYRGPMTPDIVEEQCYDISKGGMFVRSFNPLPNGTLIKFECHVGDNPNDIQGIGRVVWQRDQDCPEAPSGMGVKFLVLRPGSPEVIASVIRKAGTMPKLFETHTKPERQSDQQRAQQRTSDRAKTLVGNQASKLAVEIERNRSAKREQLLLTAENAQKLVIEAQKKKAEKRQAQSASIVRSAPIIAITHDAKPRDDSATITAIGQTKEPQSQPASVKAVAQDEGQQNQKDEIRTGANAVENNTARALRLAARRAEKLATEEATQLSLEVATRNTARTKKRNAILSVKGLAFISVIAVILLRIGYATYGGAEIEQRAEREGSAAANAESAAAQVGSDQRSSREEATRALGSDQPSVEQFEESKRNALAAIEPSTQDALKKAAQTLPIEGDKEIKPQASQTVQSDAIEARPERRKSRFERAAACQRRGNHNCVIRLLSDRVSSEQERRLLDGARQSAQEEADERASASDERAAKPTGESADSSRTSGGIPDNPFPE